MKIIYAQDNGVLGQLIPAPRKLAELAKVTDDGKVTGNLLYPTEESQLIHIANKDLPTGTKYEITDADLSDRSFRNAWEYVAGASEKTSEDLSLDDQLKYNKITQEEYDAS